MKNKRFMKYAYLFFMNLLKFNRYKFLSYDIFLKTYRFDNFIKEISRTYGHYKKLKYPKNLDIKSIKTVSSKSFDESYHLKNISGNSTFFFYELNSFFNNDYYICLNSTISKKLLDSFHLFPPNIFVLSKIFDLHESKEIGSNYVLDFPCGITNFHQYLSLIYNDSLLIGIDNFSQITRESVEKYQFNLKKFEIYEDINDLELETINIDIVVVVSIEIKNITSEILKLNSKYIFLGSSDLNHDIKNLDNFLTRYQIEEINHAYILLKKII